MDDINWKIYRQFDFENRTEDIRLATRWHKVLSSFEPKVQVSISDHLYSNVRLSVRLSVNF